MKNVNAQKMRAVWTSHDRYVPVKRTPRLRKGEMVVRVVPCVDEVVSEDESEVPTDAGRRLMRATERLRERERQRDRAVGREDRASGNVADVKLAVARVKCAEKAWHEARAPEDAKCSTAAWDAGRYAVRHWVRGAPALRVAPGWVTSCERLTSVAEAVKVIRYIETRYPRAWWEAAKFKPVARSATADCRLQNLPLWQHVRVTLADALGIDGRELGVCEKYATLLAH